MTWIAEELICSSISKEYDGIMPRIGIGYNYI